VAAVSSAAIPHITCFAEIFISAEAGRRAAAPGPGDRVPEQRPASVRRCQCGIVRTGLTTAPL